MARTKKDPSQKKKPGPKPREKRSEVRTYDLHIRVSQVEKDALARKAKAGGFKSVSDYIRFLAELELETE